MLDKSFALLFYLKKPKGYLRGVIPIYLRITVDGASRELLTKRTCDRSRWNPVAGRATGTKQGAKSLNNYLDTLQSKIYETKRRLIETNQSVTASSIKEILLGDEQRNKMLIKIFERFNERVEKLIGRDYSKATWLKYDRTRRFIIDFIHFKYRMPDVPIACLDLEFINDLEVWFKTERKCGQNATMKYISILKMVVHFCVNNSWLSKDPFVNYKIKKQEIIPEFLIWEELQRVANKEIRIERLKQVRDVFLFCCFTGLAYVDVKKLKSTEVANGVDGRLWIFTNRAKTKIATRIPLLPASQRIIESYREHPQCINKGTLLPVLTNQKYNSYLKELADICGIYKNLTTHTARHTFATTVTLSNGVPIESVSKMLGHKKLQTTQHYARVLDIKVSEDMKALRYKFHTLDDR